MPPFDTSALRVVALGGGTGLPATLRGLKEALSPVDDPSRLTAIVTVADDGGSSGRLRREHGVPAPGDIRNCLLALSDGDPLLAHLFDFRFEGVDETAGHSLGNLILTALSRLENGFDRAVEQSGRLLRIRGRVFPATLEPVGLRAEFVDGTSVDGESRIPLARRRIRRIQLEPDTPAALPQAVAALETADLIVIGPGSLYTSLIPILLVKDIAEAIGRSRARVVLVANLMTEPGETDGYTTVDHVDAIHVHAAAVRIHDVLLNAEPVPADLIERYAAGATHPVAATPDLVRAGCRPVVRALLAQGPKIRHDPTRLGRALVELGPLAPNMTAPRHWASVR